MPKQAKIDLSVAAIRAICRGDPANLPRFMVHDDQVWPWGRVQLDSLKRIHLRRTDFLNVVAPAIPTRPGLWHRVDVQEFLVDLTPANLDGDGARRAAPLAEYREITADPDRCPECSGELHTTASGGTFCLSCNYGSGPTQIDAGESPEGDALAERWKRLSAGGV